MITRMPDAKTEIAKFFRALLLIVEGQTIFLSSFENRVENI